MKLRRLPLLQTILAVLTLNCVTTASAWAQSWEETLAEASGQTLFFNAWGGDERINAYIEWAGERVQEDFGVTVRHVKLADTAEAVNRVQIGRAHV